MIGEKIKDLRTAYGYTRQVAAERLGVTSTTIQNWEIGKTIPNLLTLKAIAYEYGVTVDYLTSNSILDASRLTRQKMIQTINSMSEDDISAFNRIVMMFAGVSPREKKKEEGQTYLRLE